MALYYDITSIFSLIQWLKKRAEKRVPAIMKPGSKADKVKLTANLWVF